MGFFCRRCSGHQCHPAVPLSSATPTVAIDSPASSIPTLHARRRVDLLKIDIDNARVESALVAAIERLVAINAADVRAVVFEAQTSQGAATSVLAAALSRMQAIHGYHAYRLAHHLHSVADPEGWYSPCIGVRALKLALYIRPLSAQQWASLLALRKDKARGRAESTSFVLSKEALGRGPEARWGRESMDGTMPAEWKVARCGAPGNSPSASPT